jgi:L-malate glycosyltransferase
MVIGWLFFVMKILILPSYYPNPYNLLMGGFFREHALALQKSGSEVVVINIQFISLKAVYDKKIVKFGVYISNDEGVVIHNIIIPKFPKIEKIDYIIRKYAVNLYLYFFLKKWTPDIVHIHSYRPADNAIYLKEKHGIPIVVTEHSSAVLKNKLPMWKKILANKLYQTANKVFSVSREFSQIITKQYKIEVKYIPNPIDFIFFEKKIFQLDSQYDFINVAFANENKNQYLLLDAFKESLNKDSNLSLIIVGDGPIKKKLEDYSENIGISSSVNFFGSASKKQVRECLHKSKVFVLTSKHETFGVVLIEAMASGLNFVATKSPGPNVIFNDTGIGFLCNHDKKSVSNCMLKAIKQENNSSNISITAKKYYSFDAVSKKEIKAYKKTLLG